MLRRLAAAGRPSSSGRRRHAREFEAGLPSLALAPFTTVAREAPAAVAARIAAPVPAAPPMLPDVNGLVDEVMRRIDRRFRSDRLRRGL